MQLFRKTGRVTAERVVSIREKSFSRFFFRSHCAHGETPVLSSNLQGTRAKTNELRHVLSGALHPFRELADLRGIPLSVNSDRSAMVLDGPHSTPECGPPQAVYFQYFKQIIPGLVRLVRMKRRHWRRKLRIMG
jgi:hypothetical protein